MDTDLIGPDNPLGYPAPYWFLVFFKVLGFTLHMGPMHLWYAGLLVMLLLRWRGGAHAARLSGRLINTMPVIIAMGVNFGIVPLLFTQVAYYKVFYPASILIAWPWFSIFILLTLAYYGVYIYVIGLRRDRLSPLKQAAGWLAAFLFVVMGFLFSNNFSLMTNVGGWAGLWEATNAGGATTGLALNTADPTLWPRWLMMFGLALTTTAAYTVVDAGLFASSEGEDYRRWVAGFALKLYTLGLVWFAVTGSWYIFGALRPEIRALLFGGPMVILTTLTALGPGLPWLLLLAAWRGFDRRLALLTGLAQVGVLACNAVSRQVVQNAELAPYLDVTAEPVNTQWGPLLLFLGLFVAGLGVTGWMIRQVAKAQRQPVTG
ncbi:MAG: hypothetical protein L0346_00695 [Chloroflexi bacterium]|nr:hypothetical protein [Chloroflexota bacterium]